MINPLIYYNVHLFTGQEAEDACGREGAHLATALTKTQAAAVWVAVIEAGLQEAWLGLRHEEVSCSFHTFRSSKSNTYY